MIANARLTAARATSNWFLFPKPNPHASLRLFCFPYAGGRASNVRLWPDNLPRSVEVCAVELPARGRRMKETAFTRITPLVESITHSLYHYLDKPFAFFGHSMGALISFELARQLRREYGKQPAHIFVSGRRAPQIPDRDPPTNALPETGFVAELRRLNGTPKEVLEHSELLQFMLPVLRADFEVNETYEYTPAEPFSCPITALGGLQDKEVKRSDLEGWQEQTSGSFVLRMFPGDHFFLNAYQPLFLRSLSYDLHNLVSGFPARQYH
jgi:medium-chain acyl-[acyl-carrier-protein] hydrolase